MRILLVLLAASCLLSRPGLAQTYFDPLGAGSAPSDAELGARAAKLVELLHSSEPVFQHAALLALQQLYGLSNLQVAAEVRPLLASEHDFVREAALDTLASLDFAGSLDTLLAMLDSQDAGMRRQASQAFNYNMYNLQGGPDEKRVVAALLEHLRDADSEVRSNLIMSLGNLRSGTDELLPVLIELLKESSPTEQWDSTWQIHYALSQMEGKAVPALLELLADPSPAVQRVALDALADSNLAQHAMEAFDTILAFARSAPEELRGSAWRAAIEVSRHQPEDYFAVLAELEAIDPGTLMEIVGQSWYGTVPAALVDNIVPGLESPDAQLRMQVASLLSSTPGYEESSIAVLAALLADEEQSTSAAWALQQLSDRGMAALESALATGSSEQKLAVLSVMSYTPQFLDQHVELLTAMIDDPSPKIQGQAMQALARSGSDVTALVPRMTELLSSPGTDPVVQQGALEVLGAAGAAAAPAVAVMVNALYSDELAYYAIQALGQLGPAASSAVPRLSELAGRTDYAEVAQWALSEILNGKADESAAEPPYL